MVDSVISIRDLQFSFGQGDLSKQILFDINLDIHAGEIVLLTGPSGSGKTTLLTLIAALRTLQAGTIDVLGYSLHSASSRDLVDLRRKIGFIFQQHNLLGFLTARQNVELMFQLHPQFNSNQIQARTGEILEQVGLGERLDYHPNRLSGGQKQRVAIARSLACEPQLILADEPTAALDGKSGREVVNLLLGLAREKKCPILMVTHDTRVLDIADRTIHMEDGRVVSQSIAG
jgi:putative ABC transport system ATP-binding protein